MKALRIKDMMKPQSKSHYFTSLRLNATEPPLEPSIEFVEKRLNIPLIAYPMRYLPDIV
ncbi:hypothetical protein XNC1_0261 [Xenorhabdus nematophila ATCC 19061]|uniref:Uncharacterized protein n=2 Tax=Xenorhabdus nematophila TaxID=628 RepID=D3VH64_XENNA|nr:hypothetical protein XNC1_0261 [Xenorhabdus nematophila ATCC 19061]CEK21265.1 hypothetical protein XNC2_0261 [Xenorhabdus nematophila AN6/1]